MQKDKNFCCPEKYMVLIPYSDLEKMVNMATEMDEMKILYKRTEQRFAAIQNMFSECLEKIREFENFVKD